MSLAVLAVLLSLLAALFLAAMLAAEKERRAREQAALFRRVDAVLHTAAKRTRHLSPHRAAIDRLKGKENAARRP